MRWLRGTLMLAMVVAIVGLLALNWRTQLQTQQKLDALAASLAERPIEGPPPAKPAPEVGAVPKELSRPSRPPYIIEAPDQLLIEAAVKDPKTGAVDRLPTQPISGAFHVRPDGTVSLGVWGSVYVSGLTLDQAAMVVRKQLAEFASAEMPADKLTVAVDVAAYNSKKYYVITDFDGHGEQVCVFSCTGNETVLDAIGNIGGLADVAGKRNIWVARSTSYPGQPWQKLPVDWVGITQNGVTTTNYQLLPGDRLYVKHKID